jgi:hypothetical protein
MGSSNSVVQDKRLMATLVGLLAIGISCRAQDRRDFPVNDKHIVYHDVAVDSSGSIAPWFRELPSQAYDHDLRLLWDFWIHMRKCPNGVPYFLQHQVWKAGQDDPRGLGGDQISMALDSWDLLYDYLGDPAIRDNMAMMADYWLDHGLSDAKSLWPNLPFPYNTDVESGQYDGDMRAGKGYLQPDKAGSFGAELVMLYKKTGNAKYLSAAIKIANTLAAKIQPGNAENSPWPFRVNAFDGTVAQLGHSGKIYTSSYTANWSPTLRLFNELDELKRGHRKAYRRAALLVTVWLKKYPMVDNRWGPFFEDVGEYSDTEINADTMVQYILETQVWDKNWQRDAARILRWTEDRLGNHEFEALHVVPINEQTHYLVPGNSHTARHGSVELLYAEETGDAARVESGIRRLNWATYSVDADGRNRYPRDDIWLTDGYGDYVRHYLRAMAALPALAPENQNHLLRSTSVIQSIDYRDAKISYKKFDARSVERIKIGSGAPTAVHGGSMNWDAASRVLTIDATQAEVSISLR